MVFLGLADLVSALLLVRGFYHFTAPEAMIFAFALYLIAKGLLFISDIGSVLDIAAGVLLVVSIGVKVPFPILLAFAGFLGVKGALSMFAAKF